MERLTERVEGIGVIGPKLRKYDDPLRVIETLAAKLAAYEDSGLSPRAVCDLANAHVKPGFQLEAPFPIGTKFYVLMYGYVEEQVLIGYKYRHGKLYMISDYGDWWKIGVDAWLTHAEARAALNAAIELEKRRRIEIGGNIGPTD